MKEKGEEDLPKMLGFDVQNKLYSVLKRIEDFKKLT